MKCPACSVRPLASLFTLIGLIIASSSPTRGAEPRWVPIGPGGGFITVLAQAPSNPERLYAAGSPSGIFRSRDGGRSWQSIDRDLEGLEVRHLTVDPRNPDHVFADVASQSPPFQVWRSADGGNHWTSSAKPPRKGPFYYAATDIVFDAVAPRTLYAATGAGIYRSRDGGATWDPWALPDLTILALTRDPSAASVWYAAGRTLTGAPDAIYRSDDGGVTWHPTASAGSPSPGSFSLPNRLFFRSGALYAVWEGALYRSIDGATTFEVAARLPTIPANDFRFSPSGAIYAATYLGVYRSTDGVHWSPSETTSVNQASPRDSVAALAPLGGDAVVAVGNRGAWRSTDGGATWRAASRNLDARIVGDLIVVPDAKGTVIGGFAEGPFRTQRGESTWQRLPVLPGFEVPSLAADPHHPGRIYALGENAQDNVAVSDDLGKTWRSVGDLLLSDALLLRVDPFHDGVLFAGTELGHASSANGFAYRSADGGATWTEMLGFDYLLDITFDGGHPDVVYRANYAGIDKSTDDGRTWTPLPAGLSQALGSYPLSLQFDSRTHTLYAGTYERGVFKSTDGGKTFRRIVAGLPRLLGGKNPPVASIVRDAAGEIYAGLERAGVFRLRAGTGWEPVSLGLPLRTFFGRLAADPARPGPIYAATYGSSVLRLEERSEAAPVEIEP